MTPLNQTGADLSFDPLSPMSHLDRSAGGGAGAATSDPADDRRPGAPALARRGLG